MGQLVGLVLILFALHTFLFRVGAWMIRIPELPTHQYLIGALVPVAALLSASLVLRHVNVVGDLPVDPVAALIFAGTVSAFGIRAMFKLPIRSSFALVAVQLMPLLLVWLIVF